MTKFSAAIPFDRSGASFFHVTHWKAGSQWMRAILEDLFGPAIVTPENFETQLFDRPIAAGKVYPCVYLAKQEFQTLPLPEGCRRFVLIRDLRDTLISAYFSIRHSHKVDNPLVNKWRIVVSTLNEEEGILYLMEVWLNLCGNIQRSWLEAGETVFRLEDCMKDAVGLVTQMFQTGWGLPVDAASLKAVVSKHSFEKLSGGRRRGSEDTASHYRKGIHGDWQNHFTPAVTRRFKALYNDLLVMGGYEKDANWSPDQPSSLQL